eukprot:TRINITY_DN51923_c0_g1_i1.p1 TRINITY_DN51923_c0_g1~~TRINITY_DN51923_c0_g1_i1.p1  ORF type:complete len:907 (+),score=176.64 TRINITY_DN51923_c0_g1_i1:78-2798(+)
MVDFRIVVHEASNVPSGGGFLVKGGVYVSINIDEEKAVKSHTVDFANSMRFDYSCNVRCDAGAKQMIFVVKRAGFMGHATHLASCAFNVDSLDVIRNEVVNLFEDGGRGAAGHLRLTIERADRPPPSASGGLTNHAGIASHTGGASGGGLVNYTASGGGGGLMNHAISGGRQQDSSSSSSSDEEGGGLRNRSSTAASGGGLVNYSRTGSTGGGLTNVAPGGGLTNTSTQRPGSTGLANLASEHGDGRRANALPRAQELLASLTPMNPVDPDHRQTLAKALEELRHAPEDEQRSEAGMTVIRTCEELVRAIFSHMLAAHDEQEANKALWLAGRLATLDLEESPHTSLQDELRREWDKFKMEEAFKRAASKVSAAANAHEAALDELMDALDLFEWHAQVIQADTGTRLRQIFQQLQAPLAANLARMAASTNLADLEQVETIFNILGAARMDALGLRPLKDQLQIRRGLDALRAVLTPFPGEIGFSAIKERQLRHAVMLVRTAVAEDSSGRALTSLADLILRQMLPTLLQSNVPTAVVAIFTALDLNVRPAEVWEAVHAPFNGMPSAARGELAGLLLQRMGGRDLSLPPWLLTPQQNQCLQKLQQSIGSRNPAEIQAACQQVMATDGAKEVCQHEMSTAIDTLREAYRLPEDWDVDSMLMGVTKDKKLLAKREITDPSFLQLFDRLLKETTNTVWTRDRKGRVPHGFDAVRAVQVMNAPLWAKYAQRRDEIAAECAGQRVRFDAQHWQTDFNGQVMTLESANRVANAMHAPPLLPNANEFWFFHGTSHVAAEGITTDDFDMTRANPSGLFGAGVYFAESVSKSDEYTEGKAVHGEELFPLLLCRVSLGNVYYCDERRPDRRQLEDRCLRGKYHSVLGDRKKASGTFREFIVYDNMNSFPAYIVYYRRRF